VIYWVRIGFMKKQSKISDEFAFNKISQVIVPLVLQTIPVLHHCDLRWAHLYKNGVPGVMYHQCQYGSNDLVNLSSKHLGQMQQQKLCHHQETK
jgi:hypothetical protein